ncbi:hypothetical protein K504DRAFT_212627 [Pleomassaria siparia CBS 279.74]|uniref:C3H1-type domain-containing protein n=1 Tax=Pleomassaria siparia CBS 279.74 TaxID=1314801 RepID=A0A6G1KIU6_9PLEO|nr:hypothetical protein K504DRAFT_212627 [Pleomassaria siparia CBS 279.74]
MWVFVGTGNNGQISSAASRGAPDVVSTSLGVKQKGDETISPNSHPHDNGTTRQPLVGAKKRKANDGGGDTRREMHDQGVQQGLEAPKPPPTVAEMLKENIEKVSYYQKNLSSLGHSREKELNDKNGEILALMARPCGGECQKNIAMAQELAEARIKAAEEAFERNWQKEVDKTTAFSKTIAALALADRVTNTELQGKIERRDANITVLQRQIANHVIHTQKGPDIRDGKVAALEREVAALKLESTKIKLDISEAKLEKVNQVMALQDEQTMLWGMISRAQMKEQKLSRTHHEAPRDNALYLFYQPKNHYEYRDGKVRPSSYGSNESWDLGLCHGHFRLPSPCAYGDECDWRHKPLSQDEKDYIQNCLGRRGREFLIDAGKTTDVKALSSHPGALRWK